MSKEPTLHLNVTTQPIYHEDVVPTELAEIRSQLDQIDEDILMLISRRFSLTDEVGKIKSRLNLDAEDSTREAKQYKQLKRLAKDLSLPNGVEKDIWQIIMTAAKSRY